MRSFTTLAFALTVLLGSIGSANAAVYRVTGELHEVGYDSAPFLTGNVGTFEIIVDTDDPTKVIHAGDPGLISPLEIAPWYGYTVTSASVTMNSTTIVGSSFYSYPAVADASLDSEFYIEGVPIDQLTDQDIFIFLEDGPSFAYVGYTTETEIGGTFYNIMYNEFRFSPSGGTTATGYSSAAVPGGGVQNLAVELIPEPASLALLGMGTLVLAQRRRRA